MLHLRERVPPSWLKRVPSVDKRGAFAEFSGGKPIPGWFCAVRMVSCSLFPGAGRIFPFPFHRLLAPLSRRVQSFSLRRLWWSLFDGCDIMQKSLNLPSKERKEGMMIRDLARLVFRQAYVPRGILEEPDPPPARCPLIGQTKSIPASSPCTERSTSGTEASHVGVGLQEHSLALVALFTELAQRRLQALYQQQEETHEYCSYHPNPPRAHGLRLRAPIDRCAQVNEHQESTERQYRLQERAQELGWPKTSIEVIDEDQGRSGSSAAIRTGFRRLVSEVSLSQVGIVLMLEASRLARNSSDWHQLIELCGLSHTLLADESTIYDPRDPDDRLLLGVKGTLSEAELFTLRTRLHEGRWNKARKGLLHFPLPTGYVRAPDGAWELDPDRASSANGWPICLRRFDVWVWRGRSSATSSATASICPGGS